MAPKEEIIRRQLEAKRSTFLIKALEAAYVAATHEGFLFWAYWAQEEKLLEEGSFIEGSDGSPRTLFTYSDEDAEIVSNPGSGGSIGSFVEVEQFDPSDHTKKDRRSTGPVGEAIVITKPADAPIGKLYFCMRDLTTPVVAQVREAFSSEDICSIMECDKVEVLDTVRTNRWVQFEVAPMGMTGAEVWNLVKPNALSRTIPMVLKELDDLVEDLDLLEDEVEVAMVSQIQRAYVRINNVEPETIQARDFLLFRKVLLKSLAARDELGVGMVHVLRSVHIAGTTLGMFTIRVPGDAGVKLDTLLGLMGPGTATMLMKYLKKGGVATGDIHLETTKPYWWNVAESELAKVAKAETSRGLEITHGKLEAVNQQLRELQTEHMHMGEAVSALEFRFVLIKGALIQSPLKKVRKMLLTEYFRCWYFDMLGGKRHAAYRNAILCSAVFNIKTSGAVQADNHPEVLLTRGFTWWRMWARGLTEDGNMKQRALQALRFMGGGGDLQVKAAAFRVWTKFAREETEKARMHAISLKVMLRLEADKDQREIFGAFSIWRTFTIEAIKLANTGKRIAQILTDEVYHAKYLAFNTWLNGTRHDIAEASRKLTAGMAATKSMLMTVGDIRLTSLLSGWQKWRVFVHNMRARESKQERAMLRMQTLVGCERKRQLFGAMAHWQTLVRDEILKEEKKERGFHVLVHRMLDDRKNDMYHGFGLWREWTIQEIEAARLWKLSEKFRERYLHRKQKMALYHWREVANIDGERESLQAKGLDVIRSIVMDVHRAELLRTFSLWKKSSDMRRERILELVAHMDGAFGRFQEVKTTISQHKCRDMMRWWRQHTEMEHLHDFRRGKAAMHNPPQDSANHVRTSAAISNIDMHIKALEARQKSLLSRHARRADASAAYIYGIKVPSKGPPPPEKIDFNIDPMPKHDPRVPMRMNTFKNARRLNL